MNVISSFLSEIDENRALKMGPDMLSRNVVKELPLLAAL
jgi:hypothetical protein